MGGVTLRYEKKVLFDKVLKASKAMETAGECLFS